MRHRARGRDEPESHRLVVHVAEQAAARDVGDALALGSTRTPRIKLRSIIMPPSHVDLPEWLCPPHLTATSRFEPRAKSTALRMSADASRLDDQRRELADRGVQHAPRVVVGGMPRQQQVAAQALAELLHGGAFQRDARTVAGHRVDVRVDGHRRAQNGAERAA